MTEPNFIEWMRSTGYLLPQTTIEVERFETLHAELTHEIDSKKVDPYSIINGSFTMKETIHPMVDDIDLSIESFRMAARHYQELPDDILNKIKNNHNSKNGSDPFQSQE